MYRCFFKRLIDIILSLCGIIVFSPIMLMVAIAIKLDSPGPIFFKQKRIGLHKKYFNIFKFRSMPVKIPPDVPTHQLGDVSSCLSKFQKFIRKSSLDELPQLFNILSSKMSIIGPRPALWNQYDLIEERDKYGANDIKPGLTGWAQINGRDELEISEKACYDGEYVEKMGFLFDVKCFIGTIVTVLKKDGVVEGGTESLESENEEAKTLF